MSDFLSQKREPLQLANYFASQSGEKQFSLKLPNGITYSAGEKVHFKGQNGKEGNIDGIGIIQYFNSYYMVVKNPAITINLYLDSIGMGDLKIAKIGNTGTQQASIK